MTGRKLSLYLYKGTGSRIECSNYRGISLLSIPGKVYGRILTERLMEVTEGKVSEDQGSFRKGRRADNNRLKGKKRGRKEING